MIQELTYQPVCIACRSFKSGDMFSRIKSRIQLGPNFQSGRFEVHEYCKIYNGVRCNY